MKQSTAYNIRAGIVTLGIVVVVAILFLDRQLTETRYYTCAAAIARIAAVNVLAIREICER